MADLNIERTEKRNIWPWILGLLLLALLAWWLLGRGDDNTVAEGGLGDTAAAVAPATPASGAADAGAVGAFLTYADEARGRAASDLTHEYTADGIRRLGAALRTVAGDADAGGQVNRMNELADAMQADPQSAQHAEQARTAFVAAATLIGEIQQQRFPDLSGAATDVREAAEAMQGSQPLLEQGARVQQFFEHAAAALRGMTAG